VRIVSERKAFSTRAIATYTAVQSAYAVSLCDVRKHTRHVQLCAAGGLCLESHLRVCECNVIPEYMEFVYLDYRNY
jgi:hypothetical protein